MSARHTRDANVRQHQGSRAQWFDELIGKGSKVLAEDCLDINGALLNPKSCVYPRELIRRVLALFTQ